MTVRYSCCLLVRFRQGRQPISNHLRCALRVATLLLDPRSGNIRHTMMTAGPVLSVSTRIFRPSALPARRIVLAVARNGLASRRGSVRRFVWGCVDVRPSSRLLRGRR